MSPGIPWQERNRFRQALESLAFMNNRWGSGMNPVRSLAGEIQSLYRRICPELETLCAATCPGCRENCCERATIWYDFRDLVYLGFSQGPLPDTQIVKTGRPKGGTCPNLGDSGCILPRDRRPFVCTWYFCPGQKALPPYGRLRDLVTQIKTLRGRMEDEFCRISVGGR